MLAKGDFLSELKDHTGKVVDIFLVSGNKLDDVTLKEVGKEIVKAEGKRELFVVPLRNVDYVKLTKAKSLKKE